MSDYTPQKHLRFYSPLVKHMQQLTTQWAKAEPALPIMAAQISQWKADLERATLKAETPGEQEAKAALGEAEKAIPDRKAALAHAQDALRSLYMAGDGVTKADQKAGKARALKAADEKTFIGKGAAATGDPFGKVRKSPDLRRDLMNLGKALQRIGDKGDLPRQQWNAFSNAIAELKRRSGDIPEALSAMNKAESDFNRYNFHRAGLWANTASVAVYRTMQKAQPTPTPAGDGIDTDEVSGAPEVMEMAGKRQHRSAAPLTGDIDPTGPAGEAKADPYATMRDIRSKLADLLNRWDVSKTNDLQIRIGSLLNWLEDQKQLETAWGGRQQYTERGSLISPIYQEMWGALNAISQSRDNPHLLGKAKQNVKRALQKANQGAQLLRRPA